MDTVQNLLRDPQTDGRSVLGSILLLSVSALLLSLPTRAQELVPSTRIEFLKYGSMATQVAQSRDGTYIAIGARDVPDGRSRVVLWNQITKERVRNAVFPSNRPPKLAFDSSGTRLAVAPAGGGGSIWHLGKDPSAARQLTTAPVNDLAFGFESTLGVGETSSAGGAVRVWYNGLDSAPAVLETEGPVRSIAFGNNTSDVVLATGPTQAILWNYRSSRTKQFDTFDQCKGEFLQVAVLGSARSTDDYFADHFYIVTQRQAECKPDYLCRIDVETGSVTERFRRKNIRNVVALDNSRVAFSRGRHVYTLNLRTQEEKIIFHSENVVHDLSYVTGRLVAANSDVVALEL